jgi:hypothetical protein
MQANEKDPRFQNSAVWMPHPKDAAISGREITEADEQG